MEVINLDFFSTKHVLVFLVCLFFIEFYYYSVPTWLYIFQLTFPSLLPLSASILPFILIICSIATIICIYYMSILLLPSFFKFYLSFLPFKFNFVIVPILHFFSSKLLYSFYLFP